MLKKLNSLLDIAGWGELMVSPFFFSGNSQLQIIKLLLIHKILEINGYHFNISLMENHYGYFRKPEVFTNENILDVIKELDGSFERYQHTLKAALSFYKEKFDCDSQSLNRYFFYKYLLMDLFRFNTYYNLDNLLEQLIGTKNKLYVSTLQKKVQYEDFIKDEDMREIIRENSLKIDVNTTWDYIIYRDVFEDDSRFIASNYSDKNLFVKGFINEHYVLSTNSGTTLVNPGIMSFNHRSGFITTCIFFKMPFVKFDRNDALFEDDRFITFKTNKDLVFNWESIVQQKNYKEDTSELIVNIKTTKPSPQKTKSFTSLMPLDKKYIGLFVMSNRMRGKVDNSYVAGGFMHDGNEVKVIDEHTVEIVPVYKPKINYVNSLGYQYLSNKKGE